MADRAGKSAKGYPYEVPESGLRELRSRGPGHVLVAQPVADDKWAVYVAAAEMVANDPTVLANFNDLANDEDG